MSKHNIDTYIYMCVCVYRERKKKLFNRYKNIINLSLLFGFSSSPLFFLSLKSRSLL